MGRITTALTGPPALGRTATLPVPRRLARAGLIRAADRGQSPAAAMQHGESVRGGNAGLYYPNMSWDNESMVPLRALANPSRIRIVSLLTGAAMSATEVAGELGIAHASASYHLRQLASAGFLRLVGDRPAKAARGQPPRRYAYDPSSGDRLDRSSGRYLVQEATFVDLRRRLARMTRQRRGADAEVWLPREVWEEVVTLVDEAVRLVHDKAGPPRTEGSVHVSMTATLFELG
jgi:DNA-binding transcriptional ArsR family regulator